MTDYTKKKEGPEQECPSNFRRFIPWALQNSYPGIRKTYLI